MKPKTMPDATAEPQFRQAAAAIRSADTILIVSHIFPDGDAVGTLLGLGASLRELGKNVSGAIDGGVPPDLAFLPQSASIASQITQGEFDLLIAVDSSDIERIGIAGAYGLDHCKTVINLDHHATNTHYGDIQVIVPGAVSATEVAFDLLSFMDIDLEYDAAYALLTGLVTDTQGFRIHATNARTLEIAQALMKLGAPLPEIMARTLNRRPYQDIELWKLVLPSVTLDAGLISANITQKDYARSGVDAMSDGGLVNHLVNVDQAKVSVVFKETRANQIEVGFRSEPGYDVASLAYQLGGGGHKQASGCTVAGSLLEVRDRVLPLARQVVENGPAALD